MRASLRNPAFISGRRIEHYSRASELLNIPFYIFYNSFTTCASHKRKGSKAIWLLIIFIIISKQIRYVCHTSSNLKAYNFTKVLQLLFWNGFNAIIWYYHEETARTTYIDITIEATISPLCWPTRYLPIDLVSPLLIKRYSLIDHDLKLTHKADHLSSSYSNSRELMINKFAKLTNSYNGLQN